MLFKIFLEELKKIPLSNFDIKKIDPTVKITNSNELFEADFMDEFFNEQTGVMLFLTFPEKETWGHWVGLIKKGKTVEWYDPYAILPVRKLRKSLGGIEDSYEEEERLKELAKKNGYSLIFNNFPLQNISNRDDQACGRYVMLRLAFKKLPLDEFNELMKQVDPSLLAVLGTIKHK